MAKYIWTKDGFVEAGEYYRSLPPRPKTPFVIRDIDPYRSIADENKTVITSRSDERDYMKRHDLVKAEDLKGMEYKDPSQAPGDLKADLKATYEKLEGGNAES